MHFTLSSPRPIYYRRLYNQRFGGWHRAAPGRGAALWIGAHTLRGSRVWVKQQYDRSSVRGFPHTINLKFRAICWLVFEMDNTAFVLCISNPQTEANSFINLFHINSRPEIFYGDKNVDDSEVWLLPEGPKSCSLQFYLYSANSLQQCAGNTLCRKLNTHQH